MMNQKNIQPGWCDGCNPDNCSGCATAQAVPAQAGEYPELPEWSKRDDLGGLVPSEVRQALRAYADETCEARAAAASKPQVKEARERRRWLSDSFNRGAQTLDEATVSARAMALATPAQAVDAPGAPCEPSITLDFKMATELLKMFGEEPGLVTLQHGSERSHSGTGLYALYSHLPEEGAEFLGAEPDNKAMPEAAAGVTAAPVDADTGRLNWLERHSDGFYNLDRISAIVGKGFFTGPFTDKQKKHATLREAIDAAMNKGGAT